MNSKQFIESAERGYSEFELMIVLLSYLFKKNIRFYYLVDQAQLGLQLNGGSGGESSPSHKFGEFNLVYDMSPEQTFLKLYIRAQRPKQLSSNEIGLLNMSGMSSRVKIHLDLICNEFEYEILYKRAFSSSPVLLEMHNLQSEQLINENFMQQANKHKRVYSQGNYASTGIGGSNASPASHLNLYGSPNQLKNQAVLQQEIQNPALLSQMAMNNTSPQLGLGPQNISMLYQ